jgi:hypothetical protein
MGYTLCNGETGIDGLKEICRREEFVPRLINGELACCRWLAQAGKVHTFGGIRAAFVPLAGSVILVDFFDFWWFTGGFGVQDH